MDIKINALQQFHCEEFGSLDVLLINGKPYFPATECAKILGYTKPENAISRHCKGSLKRGVHTNGGNQGKKFIPEGDLYRLIIRSKLPAASRFESWIFDTILPCIRRHGAYITPETLDEIAANPDFAVALLKELQKEREKNAELIPKARYYDKILQSKGSVPVSIIAKDYGMSALSFNHLLHELHIQYKMAETWLLYQEYADKGYTKTRTFHYGEDAAAVHTRWTQRGRMFLYDTLLKYGITPIPVLEDDFDTFHEDTNNERMS
jgi:prophage antirepressor-like protein